MSYATQHKYPIQKKKSTKNRGLFRMLICSLLFLIAVIAKITGIPGIADTVTDWIDAGSVEDTFAVLGMNVTDNTYVEVFASLWEQLESAETAVSEQQPEPVPVAVSVIDVKETVPTLTLVTKDPIADGKNGQVSIEDVLEETIAQTEHDVQDSSAPDLPEIVSAAAVPVAFSHVSPVSGTITSAFGYRDHPLDGEYKFHYGVDVGAAEGTAILAFADGVVNTVLQGEINGNYFKLGHDDGIVSMYAHCQKILVEPGQRVKKGDVIAYVGQTGKVSGPHLHFQLYQNGKIIDPTSYIEVAA